MITCDRCGSDCKNGYQERTYGPIDSETGYQDSEIVCHACLDEQDSEDDAEGEYEHADMMLSMRMDDYDA